MTKKKTTPKKKTPARHPNIPSFFDRIVEEVKPIPAGNATDEEYNDLLDSMRDTFKRMTEGAGQKGMLFRTTVDPDRLVNLYLRHVVDRQYHNCNACLGFIRRYGGLVTVDDDGMLHSPIWNAGGGKHYADAFRVLGLTVEGSFTAAPFYTHLNLLGHPGDERWHHFSFPTPPGNKVRANSSPQKMAGDKLSAYNSVRSALEEIDTAVLDTTIHLLSSDLYRGTLHAGPARWLRNLKHHERRLATKNNGRQRFYNLLLREVTIAPEGFCHPRASAWWTLYEDLRRDGCRDYAAAKRRYEEKMNPLRYQRPQEAPKAQTIVAAEKLVKELGIESALKRRYLEPHEIRCIWKGPAATEQRPLASGIFADISPRPEDPTRRRAWHSSTLHLDPKKMTVANFVANVLPTAESIEIDLDEGVRYPFAVLTTALNPDAKPILKWDREDSRNPVAWYFWNGGARPTHFCLTGTRHTVYAVSESPETWGAQTYTVSGQRQVLFFVAKARETRNDNSALFPEMLRGELHSVRSVIEAYSQKNRLHDYNISNHAVAIAFTDTTFATGKVYRIHVTAAGTKSIYILDRMA